MERKNGKLENERRTILYISTNEGSDTRITKEVRTLAREFNVIFLGVGQSEHAFVRPFCLEFHLVRGKRNRPLTILRQVLCFLRIVSRRDVHSIHVVNEQLMVFFYPFLFSRHTVLDIFDSIFLRWNLSGERCRWLKRLVYWPASRVIVTDENRRQLLPRFLQARSTVIENYPLRYDGPIVKRESGPLTLLFAGTLAMPRGGDLVEGLLSADVQIRVIMAGWLQDEGTRRLAEHERVDYRGVIPQEEVLRISATEADYIVCIYPPTNENNINASPNKIWDAVQTRIPVIVNDEINVTQIVRRLRIGVVIDTDQPVDLCSLAKSLRDQRASFDFDSLNMAASSWEVMEPRLLSAHRVRLLRRSEDTHERLSTPIP